MLRPLHDYVVVEVSEPDDKTPGGILIPDSAKKETKKGIVVAVGPGRMSSKGEIVPMFLRGKERILFGYGGTEVEFKDKQYRIMREDDVLAIID